MDNNKLGLKIVRINEGYTELLEINGNHSWEKNVWDIRKVLEHVENLNSSTAVLMLSSIQTGHILTVASIIGTRVTDCISAWIYIPSTLNISGKELVECVDVVKREILVNERNDEKLRQYFSKSYDILSAEKFTANSSGDNCAYRYYGQGEMYTLSELLSERFQTYYKDYKCVFLLDKGSNLRCLSGDNLTSKKVYSMVLVNAPSNDKGFIPYIGAQAFKEQIFVAEGEKLTIIWKKDGYRDIKKEYIAAEGSQIPNITPNEYYRTLRYKSIRVYDNITRNPLDEYTVYIGGKIIDRDLYIPECMYHATEIKVTSPGYNESIDKYDLRGQIQIGLDPKTYTYTFRFPTKDGNQLKAKVETKGLLRSTPFKGYHSRDGREPSEYGVNDIVYYPYDKAHNRKKWIIRFVCFVLGLIIGVFGAYIASKTIDNLKGQIKKKEYTPYVAQTQPETPKPVKDTYSQIVEYLDKSVKWNKHDMAKYPEIITLWDALNEYNFEVILMYKTPLKNSTKFMELINAIENDEKGKELYTETFCTRPGDYDITIDNYIKLIKRPKQQPKAKSESEKKEQKQQDTKGWMKK